MPGLDEIERKSYWLILPIGAALFAIFLPLSNLGYFAVKVIVCGSAIYALREARQMSVTAVLCFAIVAILFNPVFLVYLRDRSLWIIADLFVIFVFSTQITIKRKSTKEILGREQYPSDQSGGVESAVVRSHMVENLYIDSESIEKLRFLISNAQGEQKFEEQDEIRRRALLGYCSGFFVFHHDPRRAVSFLNSGMWIKQSFWPLIYSLLNAHLSEVFSDEQIALLSPFMMEEIIFDNEWQEGYEKGVYDAMLWVDAKEVGRSFNNI